jgi:hypothetical protein
MLSDPWSTLVGGSVSLRADLACAQIWHAGSQRCRQQVCIRCHPTQFHATIAAQNFLLVSTNKRSVFAHLLPVSFSTTPKDAGFQQEKRALSSNRFFALIQQETIVDECSSIT